MIDLELTDNIKCYFEEWFCSNCGPWTFTSEHFYGDCHLEDVKLREQLMRGWLELAFNTGYNYGQTDQTPD